MGVQAACVTAEACGLKNWPSDDEAVPWLKFAANGSLLLVDQAPQCHEIGFPRGCASQPSRRGWLRLAMLQASAMRVSRD
jgi:hypothetical protein